MAKKNLITIVVVAVVVGISAFYGGIQYQKSQRGNFSANNRSLIGNNQQRGTTGQQRGNGNGFRPVSGEITSLDGSTLTIKTQDGSSKIVVYSVSTKINKMSEGSVSDLKVGEQVTALGSENTDGTVTAQSLSLGNGMFQNMPRGAAGQNGQ